MNAKIAFGLKNKQFSNPFEDMGHPTPIWTGRQAGKSILQAQWDELAPKAITGSGTTVATIATAAPPWASKSAEEVAADLKRVSDDLKKAAPRTTPVPWSVAPSKFPKPGNMFDDLVSSASGIVKITKQEQIMSQSKEEAAKQLAAQINDKLTKTIRPGPFKLAGPATLTIKTRQSQFKKKAFLGDESMSLTSVYGGKKEVIAVFKNALPVDYAYIEIPLSDATAQLTGFKDCLSLLGVADIDTIVAGIEQQKTQAVAAEHAALMDNPEFASW